ncbi:hypothetical protein MO973_25210 [Paenibacillus sp. TRM 82003]|nr:hypothetical protein [Paenibacillus sp. TRM 82003]
MSGENHEFVLFPDTIDVSDYQLVQGHAIAMAYVHDDLINYIYDSLVWIPSKNPFEKEGALPTRRGLNLYGLTLFERHASEALIGIFSSWRDLFGQGPNLLELTVYGENKRQRDAEGRLVLRLDRDEVIGEFEKVISMARRLQEGGFNMMHFGI